MAEDRDFVKLNLNYAQINEIDELEGQSQVLTPHLIQPVPIVKIVTEEIDWSVVKELKPDKVPKPVKVISLVPFENKIELKLFRLRKMQNNLDKCYKILDKLDQIHEDMNKMINRDNIKVKFAKVCYLESSCEYEQVQGLQVKPMPRVVAVTLNEAPHISINSEEKLINRQCNPNIGYDCDKLVYDKPRKIDVSKGYLQKINGNNKELPNYKKRKKLRKLERQRKYRKRISIENKLEIQKMHFRAMSLVEVTTVVAQGVPKTVIKQTNPHGNGKESSIPSKKQDFPRRQRRKALEIPPHRKSKRYKRNHIIPSVNTKVDSSLTTNCEGLETCVNGTHVLRLKHMPWDTF